MYVCWANGLLFLAALTMGFHLALSSHTDSPAVQCSASLQACKVMLVVLILASIPLNLRHQHKRDRRDPHEYEGYIVGGEQPGCPLAEMAGIA